MLRKVMLYVPYVVVIISLVIAIVMVLALNNKDGKKFPKKANITAKAKTVGLTAKDAKPAYVVKTSPDPVSQAPATTSRAAVTPAGAVQPASTKAAASTRVQTTPQPSSVQKGPTLTNTGPGETMALFAVTVVAGAGAHSYFLRRKFEA